MSKLLFVRLYEKGQRVDVAVEDKNARNRLVVVRWFTKEPTACPDNWLKQVEDEMAHQDAEELAKSRGRKLFR